MTIKKTPKFQGFQAHLYRNSLFGIVSGDVIAISINQGNQKRPLAAFTRTPQ